MNTLSELEAFWRANDEREYGYFDRVQNKTATRPDLHAFILLDRLFPSDNGSDIVSAAEHDEIYLGIEHSDLLKLSEENIIELMRCGVRWDAHYEALCMFV